MSVRINRIFHPQLMPFFFDVKRLRKEKMNRPLAVDQFLKSGRQHSIFGRIGDQ